MIEIKDVILVILRPPTVATPSYAAKGKMLFSVRNLLVSGMASM